MTDDKVNPYDSPTVTADDQVASQSERAVVVRHPYESAKGRALFTVVMLGIGIVLDVLSAGSSFMQIQLLQRAQNGGQYTQEEADSNDNREATIGVAQVLCHLITAIGFLMWFHRAHRNLPALGATRLEHSPGWAVGSFFVPFLNLVRPYQIMKEVWKNSISSPTDRSTGQIGLWWTFWLLANISGQVSSRLTLQSDTLDMLVIASWATMVACLMSLVAGFLAIQVVRTVTGLQDKLHARVSAETASV